MAADIRTAAPLRKDNRGPDAVGDMDIHRASTQALRAIRGMDVCHFILDDVHWDRPGYIRELATLEAAVIAEFLGAGADSTDED